MTRLLLDAIRVFLAAFRVEALRAVLRPALPARVAVAVRRGAGPALRRPLNRLGFSMIEILVVLAIMSVLSGIALFGYGSYRTTASVRSTAEGVNATFAAARTAAVNRNVPYSATFDLDRQAYWLDEWNSAATAITKAKVTGTAGPADFVRLHSIKLTSGTQTAGLLRVFFFPDGRGTYAVVHLRRERDDAGVSSNYTSVRVFPSTGTSQVLVGVKK